MGGGSRVADIRGDLANPLVPNDPRLHRHTGNPARADARLYPFLNLIGLHYHYIRGTIH